MRALSYIGAEKITFPPKPDIHTDIYTYSRTDIIVYRVASLLISINSWTKYIKNNYFTVSLTLCQLTKANLPKNKKVDIICLLKVFQTKVQ